MLSKNKLIDIQLSQKTEIRNKVFDKSIKRIEEEEIKNTYVLIRFYFKKPIIVNFF